MARYRLVFKKSVARDLRDIPEQDVVQILEYMEALQQEPRPGGSEKLSEQNNRYRVRQGVYRIVYEVVEAELVVMAVNTGLHRHVCRSN